MAQPRSDRQPSPASSSPTDRRPEPDELGVVDPDVEPTQLPGPALGEPGRYVVQVNVEEDMPEGSSSKPVNEAATQHYGLYIPRTLAMVVVAIVVALLLALPVVWGIVELVSLAGLVGPWIWAWVILMIALLIASVVIGFRIAQSGL